MQKFTNVHTWKLFLELNGTSLIKKKTDYDKIIKELNIGFMETVAREGGNMSLGELNGVIWIQRVERNVDKMIPDFPSSNAIKKQIIAKGGLPLEYYKDAEGKLTGENNGGEPWLVYFTDRFYYAIKWSKHRFSTTSFKMFCFKPNKFTKRNTSKILNENPDRSILVHSNELITKKYNENRINRIHN
jgi:hypothetical protein